MRALLVVAGLAACSFDGALDGHYAADAATAPNLLPNAGMEDALLWNTYQATATFITADPHAGLRALEIEKTDTGGESLFSTYADGVQGQEVAAGTVFDGSVWVRACDGGQPMPPDLRAMVREQGNGLPDRDHEGTPAQALSGWQRLDITAVIAEDGHDNVTFIVAAQDAPDGTCFVLDDAYLGSADL